MSMSMNPVSTLPWRPELTLGLRFRMVRRKYAKRIGERVTQAKMAEICGVSESAYKQWEADNNPPEHLVDIAKHLQRSIGADAKFLLGLDEEGTGPKGGGEQQEAATYWYGDGAVQEMGRVAHLQAAA
jgi:transcriptional regulator with XRE-family HTH domain